MSITDGLDYETMRVQNGLLYDMVRILLATIVEFHASLPPEIQRIPAAMRMGENARDARAQLEEIVRGTDAENDAEAHTLLDLIDAEFQSDPMSVQCFDLRIVERVRQCVAAHKQQRRPMGARV